jgi:ribonucleoside-diphosphate reductase alpha chain
MFLDNSACNLASLNLRKFQNEDGSFDVARYRAAARIFITAQEILVDNAGYPSARSRRTRTTTVRSARLRQPRRAADGDGAVVRLRRRPRRRRGVMAIEHCEAYARSAEIAGNERIGPFAGFAPTASPCSR